MNYIEVKPRKAKSCFIYIFKTARSYYLELFLCSSIRLPNSSKLFIQNVESVYHSSKGIPCLDENIWSTFSDILILSTNTSKVKLMLHIMNAVHQNPEILDGNDNWSKSYFLKVASKSLGNYKYCWSYMRL